MDGITMGGGCGISVNGKFRLATENTVVAMPETAIGFFPDVGGGHFLPRLHYKGFPHDGEAVGRFLGLTGFRLKGADVYHVGLATHFTSASNVSGLVRALQAAGESGKLDERTAAGMLEDLTAKATLGSCSLTPHLGVIRSAFSAPTLQDCFQQLQKVADGSDTAAAAFASQQLATLRRVSPTALRVTFAHLQRGRSQPLSGVLSEEYRMTQKFMAGHDFYEGVGAVLVRKDNKPHWKPSKIEEVSDEEVNSYFTPLPLGTPELLF
jgi:enoyl-CoA hydratase/carnithine racemase